MTQIEKALRRGRPSLVSPEAIIQAARDEGLAEFTMLAVAKRLHITHGALYRYFPSKDELAIAVIDAVVDEACWDLRPAPWREVLVRFAQSLWALCADARGFAETVLGPARASSSIIRVIEEYVRVLEGGGMGRQEAAVAVEVISEEVLLTSLRRPHDNESRPQYRVSPKSRRHVWVGDSYWLEQKLALVLDGLEYRSQR